MNLHLTVIIFVGLACLLIFLLPAVLKNRVLSPSMIYVLVGFILFNLPIDLPVLDPEGNLFDRKVLEYFTEFIVILSLAAIGLKIDRALTWKKWAVTGLLLGIIMPLTILFLALASHLVLGLTLAACILLGAVLAPTDPVLADNVQVDPPNSGDGHPVKFALTAEAGLNDALAFPFVYLSIVIYKDGFSLESITSWFGYYFLLKIIIGLITGYVLGKLLSYAFFYFLDQGDQENKKYSEGTFLIAATLITYGLTELVHGYGFLAVFIAALIGRKSDSEHPAHRRTYHSINQVENFLIGIFLIVFGGILAKDGLLGISWTHISISLLLIFVFRPVAGWIGLLFCNEPLREKSLISFFGIRGIGTIYYLAFAANEIGELNGLNDIWLVANFTILSSIIIHGIADAFLMKKLED